MRRIVYASRALHDFDEEELLTLLSGSRAYNAERGITGMLVYAARSFLQAVEGEDAQVEDVWDRVRLDPRHTGLRVLGDGPAEERLFGEWAMGFEHPSEAVLEETLPGYRASVDYPFVSSQLVEAADTAETLLALYARRSA